MIMGELSSRIGRRGGGAAPRGRGQPRGGARGAPAGIFH